MGYTIDYSKFSSVFALPSLSEQTLCTATGEQLKVMLYIMQHQSQAIQPEYLANRLMISKEQAEQALCFWAKQGFLKGKQPLPQADRPTVQPTGQTREKEPEGQKNNLVLGLKAQNKTMSIDEVNTLSGQDNNIAELVDAVQLQMGKILTRSEIETLVSFYAYAGLPPEYILLAAAHCCSKNRPNIRALSKLLTDMMSENIYTYEQAEQYLSALQRRDSNQSQIRSAFGIHDRALTKQEQKYIDAWFGEYRFDISVIKLAYEKTINQIGKVSFPYINKILSSWHSKGITTTKEAALERQPTKQNDTSSIDFDQIQHFITYGEAKPESGYK